MGANHLVDRRTKRGAPSTCRAQGRCVASRCSGPADDDHGLMVSQHHIVSDQWSIGVLTSELAEAYGAFRTGDHPEMAPVPLQLGQYAAWHRNLVEADHLERDLAYWQDQLDSLVPLDLPTDRPRPAIMTSNGATIHVDVEPDLLAAIEAFCKEARTTPFIVMSAAFQLLLARYSGESDVAIGTAIANRNWYEAEQVLGSLVNTVVLRTLVDEDATFRDVVADVQLTSLDAFAHQDMPFARLVNELNAPRDPSRSPLFQAFFNVQNAPFDAPGLPGLATSRIDLERDAAQFDLSMSISTIDDAAALEYNTDLFDAARMEAMFDHYWAMLRSALATPDRPLTTVGTLTEREDAEIVEWSSGPVVEVDLSIPAHRLIEATVMQQPDAVAARFGADQVTYRELNDRSNRMARHLVERGAGPGRLVGVLVDRSIDMLVSLLAVMKSGAAYVPMDPAYPGPRLEHMVVDSDVLFVMTDGACPLPSGTVDHVTVGAVDLAGYSAEDLDIDVGADDLAYVIYTSGSTGRPKGVMIEHGNLAHYLHGTRRLPGMSASDVIVALTTLSFDISVQELILPLMVGATIEIVPRSTAVDGAALQVVLAQSGATVMQATPSTWRMLIENGWAGTPGLRIQCGGEAMTPELARELCSRSDAVWNQYGPTEATVWATFHRVDPEVDGRSSGGAVQLGSAAVNTTVHVLDEHLRDVPDGVRGELCIGGRGVGRGYLGRPELTGAVFVRVPDRPELGRIYRTGDVVVRHRDGRLTFEGRTDHQVKMRGHRIELGEIEAATDVHPDVVKSVVSVHEVGAGDERLVAYLECAHGVEAPTIHELRAFLAGELPDYMIPTMVVAVHEFPKTANNKIDRGRLPAPTPADAGLTESGERPRPGLETVVAHIWSEVLHVSDVGRHDDFFALGGHSLLAIRLFSKLASEVGNELPLSALFEAPTVAGLGRTAPVRSSRVGVDVAGSHPAPRHADAALLRVAVPRVGAHAVGDGESPPIGAAVLRLATAGDGDRRPGSRQRRGDGRALHLRDPYGANHLVPIASAGTAREAGWRSRWFVSCKRPERRSTPSCSVDFGPPGESLPGRASVRDLIDRLRFLLERPPTPAGSQVAGGAVRRAVHRSPDRWRTRSTSGAGPGAPRRSPLPLRAEDDRG